MCGPLTRDDVEKQRFRFYEHFLRPGLQQAPASPMKPCGPRGKPARRFSPATGAAQRPVSAGRTYVKDSCHGSPAMACPIHPPSGRPASAPVARRRVSMAVGALQADGGRVQTAVPRSSAMTMQIAPTKLAKAEVKTEKRPSTIDVTACFPAAPSSSDQCPTQTAVGRRRKSGACPATAQQHLHAAAVATPPTDAEASRAGVSQTKDKRSSGTMHWAQRRLQILQQRRLRLGDLDSPHCDATGLACGWMDHQTQQHGSIYRAVGETARNPGPGHYQVEAVPLAAGKASSQLWARHGTNPKAKKIASLDMYNTAGVGPCYYTVTPVDAKENDRPHYSFSRMCTARLSGGKGMELPYTCHSQPRYAHCSPEPRTQQFPDDRHVLDQGLRNLPKHPGVSAALSMEHCWGGTSSLPRLAFDGATWRLGGSLQLATGNDAGPSNSRTTTPTARVTKYFIPRPASAPPTIGVENRGSKNKKPALKQPEPLHEDQPKLEAMKRRRPTPRFQEGFDDTPTLQQRAPSPEEMGAERDTSFEGDLQSGAWSRQSSGMSGSIRWSRNTTGDTQTTAASRLSIEDPKTVSDRLCGKVDLLASEQLYGRAR